MNGYYLRLVACLLITALWLAAPALGDHSAAQWYTVGTDQYGHFASGADEDWFKFTCPGNAYYSVSFANQTTGYKYMYFYQENEFGDLIQVQSTYAWDGVTSFTVFLDAAYNAYIRVSANNVTGGYRFTATQLAIVPPDSYSDDCAAPSAITVDAPGGPTVGTISPDGDEDWFVFNTTPLHMYQVQLTHASNSWARFRLFDSACNQLLGDHTSATFVSWYGEDYKLRVHGDPARLGNYYTISVTDLGPQPDDHGNDQAHATPISANGAEHVGVMDYSASYGSDEDWFKFDVAAHTRLKVSLRHVAGNSYVYLYLYYLDSLGVLRPVMSMYRWGDNLYESRNVFLDAPGACYVQIINGAGPYTFKIETLGQFPPDSYGDDCAAPQTLVVDAAPTVGTVAPGGDLDWFRFETQPMHKYRVTLTHDTNSWVRYRMYADNCGAQLRGDSTTHTMVSWHGDAYLLRVHGDAGALGNYYTIQVEDLGLQPNDHGNTRDTATEIPHDGTWIDGELQYTADMWADEDWFTFLAPADGAYHFSAFDDVNGYIYFTVYAVGPLNELVQKANWYWWNGQADWSTTLTAGTHYIRVYSGVSPYRIRVLSPIPRCGDLEHPYPAGDVNRDCYVDLADVALLAHTWLQCTDPNPPCNYVP